MNLTPGIVDEVDEYSTEDLHRALEPHPLITVNSLKIKHQ